ncbi:MULTISPECIES: tyrosine-type recombinase/integrase [unclassified Aureimonas]|uniref:tyrosine-type recombinase/integrase n=1 Tax=unclassified Aureimonas TaxID=2615206 RepID=UPI000701D9D4|nr:MULTISPECIES: tyrosine-type recombinase/integrase [unclassified Aureimonas]KQT60381.1 integrase [Aureimonas sp. Leaf427]KQT79259.1 integrase [Aureimonas sp. Leaf460]
MKGSIRERSPGKWAIIVDVHDPETGERRRKWHSFAGTKRQAQEECARIVTSIKHGGYTEPTKITVGEFLERWLEQEASNVAPKTLERYAEIARKNIVPLLGRTTLAKLKPEAIDGAWTKALASGRRDGKGGLSPRTVHHMRRVLIKALNQAVVWEILAKNPATLSKPPKVERKAMKAYGAGTTAELLDAIRGSRIFVPVLLAVMCGLRRGEIIALRWQSIDFANRRIAVTETAEQTLGAVRNKETKTGRSRTVDLSSTVMDELRRHRAAQAEEQLKLGIRPDERSFVVAQIDGKPLQPRSLSHEWTRVLAKTSLERIRFHDLRHSHATQMLAAGVHPKVAQERLGHSTIAITLDTYSHVMPGMGADAAEQVDAAIRRAVKPQA